MTAAELRRAAIPRTLTLAARIGEAVIGPRETHGDPIGAVLSVTGGRQLFRGKVGGVQRRMVGGFARGELCLDGIDEDVGRSLTVDFQNENLIARTADGEVLAVVPDLICIVDLDTAEPITTEVVRYGLRAAVLGIPAPAMLKTPEALAVVGPAAFGYAGIPYVPLAGEYGLGVSRET
jgi:DUF917 family protein